MLHKHDSSRGDTFQKAPVPFTPTTTILGVASFLTQQKLNSLEWLVNTIGTIAHVVRVGSEASIKLIILTHLTDYGGRVAPGKLNCKASHPFAFNDGKLCCSSPAKINNPSLHKDCDGGAWSREASKMCCKPEDTQPCFGRGLAVCDDYV